MTTPIQPTKRECHFPDGDKFPEMRCRNCKRESYDMDGERYRCDVCGMSYYLDYEEMR